MSVVQKLVRELIAANVLAIFLMDDGAPLAAHYGHAGGNPLLLRMGRRGLPRPRLASYIRMFELINRAAVAARGNWTRFLRCYDAETTRFGRTQTGRRVERLLAQRVRPLLPAIAAAQARGQDVVIVDTGMQGTFALYVARWLGAQLGMTRQSVDVRLLAVYPWLAALFRGRSVTTDCWIVASLERRSARTAWSAPPKSGAGDRATGVPEAPVARFQSSAEGPGSRDGTGSRIRS
jgi:hypothetical protein